MTSIQINTLQEKASRVYTITTSLVRYEHTSDTYQIAVPGQRTREARFLNCELPGSRYNATLKELVIPAKYVTGAIHFEASANGQEVWNIFTTTNEESK